VHAFKYRGATAYAPLLADLCKGALVRRPADADCLVPVPLHPTRLRQRGYNQAALLAAELARTQGLPVVGDALVRTRSTRPQVELSAPQRRSNLRDAFECTTPTAVRGARVLLVDDVTTTGATLRACADALAAAGAARVMGVVVAKEL
jgi:ComF family protein